MQQESYSQVVNQSVALENQLVPPASNEAQAGQMLITLYDGAIRFVELAREQIRAGNASAKEISLSKAYAIIAEFMNSLDFEMAPELCTNLYNIYEFMLAQLVEANSSMNADELSPVVDHLVELRDAWNQVV